MLQLGYSLVAPILLSLALCWWICDTFGVGEWIYIPGILFGLGAAAVSFRKFCKGAMQKRPRDAQKAEKRRNRTVFNEHV